MDEGLASYLGTQTECWGAQGALFLVLEQQCQPKEHLTTHFSQRVLQSSTVGTGPGAQCLGMAAGWHSVPSLCFSPRLGRCPSGHGELGMWSCTTLASDPVSCAAAVGCQRGAQGASPTSRAGSER